MDSEETTAFNIVRTDSYLADLDEATAYYMASSGRLAASRFLDEYEKMISQLETTPKYGTKIGESNYRWRPTGVFVTVYTIDEEKHAVILSRLYYMAANWKRRILKTGGCKPESQT